MVMTEDCYGLYHALQPQDRGFRVEEGGYDFYNIHAL